MQTIIVVLNPAKLTNPDLDLRYYVPDRITEVSNGAVQGNGYEFIDSVEPLLGLWLEAQDAGADWSIISKLFQEEKFKENDLSATAKIYISENENEEIANCTLVYPKADN